jgi:hypothetical protein
MSERSERTYRVLRLGAGTGRERSPQQLDVTREVKENRVAPTI